eukprot:3933197-Rhodomonas_salina.2
MIPTSSRQQCQIIEFLLNGEDGPNSPTPALFPGTRSISTLKNAHFPDYKRQPLRKSWGNTRCAMYRSAQDCSQTLGSVVRPAGSDLVMTNDIDDDDGWGEQRGRWARSWCRRRRASQA